MDDNELEASFMVCTDSASSEHRGALFALNLELNENLLSSGGRLKIMASVPVLDLLLLAKKLSRQIEADHLCEILDYVRKEQSLEKGS